jgi:N-acetylmuramoyl-L-alanine amidase
VRANKGHAVQSTKQSGLAAAPSAADLEILTRTICGEADEESFEGKLAVGCVVINRARIARAYVAANHKPHILFGDGSISLACTIGHNGVHQFSCWNEGRDKARMLAATMETPGYADCMRAARMAINGSGENPIGGATYYYNPRRVVKTPPWAVGRTPSSTVGNHLFFDKVN